jgi:hypothetical protein
MERIKNLTINMTMIGENKRDWQNKLKVIYLTHKYIEKGHDY